ncbi:MAG: ADP-ribosylglycohydrolase family protein [Solirubrobacteraceae bacterium]
MSGPAEVGAFRGCLLGGAVGDALGAPVEFMSLDEIRKRFGPRGVTGLEDGAWPAGSITDDTQMTLFTAEGLLRAQVRGALKGIVHPPTVVDHAYARWLHTQGERSPRWAKHNEDGYDGWLVVLPELNTRRAPGRTCLSALSGEQAGTVERPVNDSKGCGGVMRIAPVGLLAPRERAFELGVEVAVLTHGHPSGHLAAGFLASVIAAGRDGHELDSALDAATVELKRYDGGDQTLAAVGEARDLARAGQASAEQVERLGAGWVAEEALAIGLYAVLATYSYPQAVVLAANHGGDSDSTAAIAGSLVGITHGEHAIPSAWLEQLELRDQIALVAEDLYRATRGHPGWDPEREWDRYPGW